MRCFGRQCRGQGKVFVGLVRQTEQQLLERGSPIATLAQAAQQGLQSATHLAERQRERLLSQLQAALAAHHAISQQSRRLTQGKRLSQCKIVNAYDSTIAPILKGKSNCPAQFGRKPGLISEPTAGFIFATHLPSGNPSDASYVVPLVDKVQCAIARVQGRGTLAIHSVASDLGANEPTVRQTLHRRGILTVGIPKTVEPLNPQPTPPEIRDALHAAGLQRKRTPYQVQLACACGYSRPVVESHITRLLARGAGQVRYKGPHGAAIQLDMTVMASNGAALVRIRQHRLSKRAQKFRRLLGLRRYKANEFNNPKN
jgi:hypothetical protein